MKKSLLLFIVTAFVTTVSIGQTDELLKIADNIRNDATGNEFMKTLEPSLDDLQAIFVSRDDVADAWMYAEELYATIPEGAVKPGAERTETLIFKITGAELRAGVKHDLPGGYNNIKDKFKDQLVIYGIKFVAPGETSGYTLNAFFKVRGHWVCIPKAWKAFEY